MEEEENTKYNKEETKKNNNNQVIQIKYNKFASKVAHMRHTIILIIIIIDNTKIYYTQ